MQLSRLDTHVIMDVMSVSASRIDRFFKIRRNCGQIAFDLESLTLFERKTLNLFDSCVYTFWVRRKKSFLKNRDTNQNFGGKSLILSRLPVSLTSDTGVLQGDTVVRQM